MKVGSGRLLYHTFTSGRKHNCQIQDKSIMICEGRHPSFPLQEHSKTEEEEAKQAEVSKDYSCEDVGLIRCMELKKD